MIPAKLKAMKMITITTPKQQTISGAIHLREFILNYLMTRIDESKAKNIKPL